MARLPEYAAPLDAAEIWRDRCLRASGSVFTDRELWTAGNLDHLVRHFVNNPDEGAGSFLDKLRGQLSAAPAAARQLAAEMLWVMFLFPSSRSMTAGTKRIQIRSVWEWSGEPLPANEQLLGSALENGIGSVGQAFHNQRWLELSFFVQLLAEWRRLSVEEREVLLADGWRMAEWIDAQPSSRNRQLRDILLYLLFPDLFENSASKNHKQQMVRRFREYLGRDPETVDYGVRVAVDRELFGLRRLLAEKFGEELPSFYASPFREIWRPEPRGPEHDRDAGTGTRLSTQQLDAWYRNRFGNARIWAVATGTGGRFWSEFRDKGIIAMGARLGDLSEYESREQIHEALVREVGGNPVVDSLAYWEFSHVMAPGDVVIAKSGRSTLLGWGTVISDYMLDPDRDEYPHMRRVEWQSTGEWDLGARHITTKTLTDFSQYKDWLHFAFELMEGRWPSPGDLGGATPGSYTLDMALDGLFLSRDEVTRIMDLLGRKKNVILEGPPGVGKTFVAQRIAWVLMRQKDPTRVGMVQFHQSYAYEDFVQGWRPAETGGFTLRDGVFYTFCERARRDDPERPYVFIIDEINRANLSKVFGELLMLIEADKRGPEYALPLTYARAADDRFYVPRNVCILGMMNTADRSIAMVDYALRRRFGFVRLSPAFHQESFTDYLLDAGVEESVVERIVTRMSALNEEIRADPNLGPGFEIGHSYFVPDARADETLDETWYEAVIRSEVEPLLKEYWFDQPRRVAETIERLLA